jgi:hypothetical protein
MLRSLVLAIAFVTVAGCIASAQSNDEALCQDDAFRLCQQTIPDRERTFQCMVANREALSPACREVMARYAPEPPPQKPPTRQAKKAHRKPQPTSPTAAR